jgi:hypothetical protein
VQQQYPSLPTGFRPEVLRTLPLRAIVVVIARYGIEQIAQRVGDEGFVDVVKNLGARSQQ